MKFYAESLNFFLLGKPLSFFLEHTKTPILCSDAESDPGGSKTQAAGI